MKAQAFIEGQTLPEPTTHAKGYDGLYGKFVLDTEVERKGKDPPERVIFLEYSLSDLELILSKCSSVKANNPGLDVVKVEKLMTRVKAEMMHRILDLIDKA